MVNAAWFFREKGFMGRKFGHGRHGREMWGPWGGPRTKRGDIKYLILEVLADGPRHGYDVITALEKKSEGRYRPSAGSVYPTLQMLEEAGAVTGEAVDGKRVFTITEAGRQMLASRTGEARDEEDDDAVDLRSSAFALGAAVMQAARVADTAAQQQVREILEKARRDVYAILAGAE